MKRGVFFHSGYVINHTSVNNIHADGHPFFTLYPFLVADKLRICKIGEWFQSKRFFLWSNETAYKHDIQDSSSILIVHIFLNKLIVLRDLATIV